MQRGASVDEMFEVLVREGFEPDTAARELNIRRVALKRRIDEAAKIVPLENICLSPQCGFSSTHHGNLLSEDEQWAKLARIVEVAHDVWG